MAKAKAGRVGSDVTLRCVELAGTFGYSETELLEKWARDSKILDIFEGTQQIQQLIVARRVLGLSSSELSRLMSTPSRCPWSSASPPLTNEGRGIRAAGSVSRPRVSGDW